jgi:catechol 2,3-dioxygenase-like lactoylglutathione lyase family enzyme
MIEVKRNGLAKTGFVLGWRNNMKFRHACVLVSDLKKSIDFYTKKLGFKVLKQKELSGSYIQNLLGVKGLELTYVKMCIPPETTPIFELHHWTDTDLVYGLRNKYTSHIALTVENLKSFYLKNHDSIKFISPPRRATDTKCTVCFIEDPDSNLIELTEDPKDDKKKKIQYKPEDKDNYCVGEVSE